MLARIASALFAALLALGAPAFAQFGADDPIEVTVKVDRDRIRPGDAFRVQVLFTPTKKFHIYAPDEKDPAYIRTTVELEPVKGIEFQKPAWPESEEHAAATGTTRVYEKPAPVVVKAKAVGPFESEEVEITARVGYQACEKVCLMPVRNRFESVTVPVGKPGDPVKEIPLEIDEGKKKEGEKRAAGAGSPAGGAPTPAVDPAPDRLPEGVLVGGYMEPEEFLKFLDTFETGEFEPGRFTGAVDDFTEKVGDSYFLAFLAAFFGGILTSLTPCVYPMIPITIAFFGRQTGRQRSSTLRLSLVYVAGIVVTYSTLGLVAALTGAQFGGLLGNPVVVSVLAAIFVALGLSSFGLFEIQAPSWLLRKLPASGKGGGVGAFVMGLVLGIVAAPCVGPILLGILTWIAEKRDALLGFTFLSVFALGMGVLFVVLAMTSRALPRAGAWMETVKKVFGVALFGVAVYYVAPLLTPAATSLVIGALLVAFAVHLAWPILRPREGETVGKPRLAIGALSAVVGLYFSLGLVLPIEGALPNPTSFIEAKSVLAWETDYRAALERSAAEKKPVFLDFTAEWCQQCREMDHLTFHDPDVVARLARFLLVRLDATDSSGPEAKVLGRFRIRGLPGVVAIAPEAAGDPAIAPPD